MNQVPNGVLPDLRSKEDKAKDFKDTSPELSIAGGVTVNWTEKPMNEWKQYPLRNQSSSSSCVHQAICKACKTIGMDILSAHPTYRLRSLYPQPGSMVDDSFRLFKNVGTTLETTDPSQYQDETTINRPFTDLLREVLKNNPQKIGGFAYLSTINIDTIAERIEASGHCLLTLQSNNNEYTAIPTVNGSKIWGHEVCAVDYTLMNGKKYIIVDDSVNVYNTTFPSAQTRLFSNEFINSRVSTAAFILPHTEVTIPSETFKIPLRKGDKGGEVVKLQDLLKHLGFMPTGVPSTGLYASITAQSVLKFQLANNVDTPEVLNSLKGERVGSKTLAALNKYI